MSRTRRTGAWSRFGLLETVVTYGQIARLLPPPEKMDLDTYQALGPRWVGSAMAACPDDVPWQRVINAQGKISDRPGAQR